MKGQFLERLKLVINPSIIIRVFRRIDAFSSGDVHDEASIAIGANFLGKVKIWSFAGTLNARIW